MLQIRKLVALYAENLFSTQEGMVVIMDGEHDKELEIQALAESLQRDVRLMKIMLGEMVKPSERFDELRLMLTEERYLN